ncbi:hypothetical protein F5B20DRAFT_524097 [Whalleya microplaca]|nr:hypothetical protein F5B20DRAFT_524097 [Whalleya microplaca]
MSSRDRQASVADSDRLKPNTNQDIEDGREHQQPQEHKSWNKAKLVLRISSLLVGIPLLCISASGFGAPKGFSSFPALGTPLSVATIIYDLANCIVMRIQRNNFGISPAATVGFELILSFGGLALSALLYFFTVDTLSWKAAFSGDHSGVVDTPIPNYVTNGWFWFGMSMAASILATILSLIHFVLFVRGCIEVDRQREVGHRQEKQVSPISQLPVDSPAPPTYATLADDTGDRTQSLQRVSSTMKQ